MGRLRGQAMISLSSPVERPGGQTFVPRAPRTPRSGVPHPALSTIISIRASSTSRLQSGPPLQHRDLSIGSHVLNRIPALESSYLFRHNPKHTHVAAVSAALGPSLEITRYC